MKTPLNRFLLGLLGFFCIGAVSHTAKASGGSLTNFGAYCDWTDGSAPSHDDTSAIRNAISAAVTANQTIALIFPTTGKCRISGPLQVPYLVSFIGSGPSTGLVADYASWDSSTNLNALDLVDTTGGFSLGQTFSDFNISGINNSSVSSVGFNAADALNNPPSVNHYIYGIHVSNISVQNFDTALQLSDVSQSSFDSIQVSGVRRGIVMTGQNLNTVIQHYFVNFFSSSHTANKGTTQGVYIGKKTYSQGDVQPEGITLTDSIILAAYEDLVVDAGFQINVTKNIIDVCSSNAVIINDVNNINFTGNYVATVGQGQTAVLVGGGINYDGLNISDNLLAGSGPSGGQNGIYFLAGFTHRNAHIENNRIQSVTNPIVFNNALPSLSSIKGNYGWNNQDPTSFIAVVSQSSPCGLGTTIEGNTSSDPKSIFTSSCSGFHLGYNYSSVQTTP